MEAQYTDNNIDEQRLASEASLQSEKRRDEAQKAELWSEIEKERKRVDDERAELHKQLNPQLQLLAMLTQLGVSVQGYQYEAPPPYIRSKSSENDNVRNTDIGNDSSEDEHVRRLVNLTTLPLGTKPKYHRLIPPRPSILKQFWAFWRKIHRPEVSSNHKRVEWICVSSFCKALGTHILIKLGVRR